MQNFISEKLGHSAASVKLMYIHYANFYRANAVVVDINAQTREWAEKYNDHNLFDVCIHNQYMVVFVNDHYRKTFKALHKLLGAVHPNTVLLYFVD